MIKGKSKAFRSDKIFIPISITMYAVPRPDMHVSALYLFGIRIAEWEGFDK